MRSTFSYPLPSSSSSPPHHPPGNGYVPRRGSHPYLGYHSFPPRYPTTFSIYPPSTGRPPTLTHPPPLDYPPHPGGFPPPPPPPPPPPLSHPSTHPHSGPHRRSHSPSLPNSPYPRFPPGRPRRLPSDPRASLLPEPSSARYPPPPVLNMEPPTSLARNISTSPHLPPTTTFTPPTSSTLPLPPALIVHSPSSSSPSSSPPHLGSSRSPSPYHTSPSSPSPSPSISSSSSSSLYPPSSIPPPAITVSLVQSDPGSSIHPSSSLSPSSSLYPPNPPHLKPPGTLHGPYPSPSPTLDPRATGDLRTIAPSRAASYSPVSGRSFTHNPTLASHLPYPPPQHFRRFASHSPIPVTAMAAASGGDALGPRKSRRRQPHSYASLIAQILLDSPTCRLPLRRIYEGFVDRRPDLYDIRERGWKNTIRHNLSLNRCFRRVPPAPGKAAYAKGEGLWELDPTYLSTSPPSPKSIEESSSDPSGPEEASGHPKGEVLTRTPSCGPPMHLLLPPTRESSRMRERKTVAATLAATATTLTGPEITSVGTSEE